MGGDNAADGWEMSEKKILIDVQRRIQECEPVGGVQIEKAISVVGRGEGRSGCRHLLRFVRAEEPPGPVSVALRFGAGGALLVVADRRCCVVTSVLLSPRRWRGRSW